jgi:hypothetical protein
VSDTDRGPFRRFPWIQLAFCIACLAMTGWTWMQYSYAWKVTPTDLQLRDTSGIVPVPSPYHDRYVCLTCSITMEAWNAVTVGTPIYLGPVPEGQVGIPVVEPTDSRTVSYVLARRDELRAGTVQVCGRVIWTEEVEFSADFPVSEYPIPPKDCVNANASRLHPASVSGLVVGAMGCFIFGLYLRRWLRERRATALP